MSLTNRRRVAGSSTSVIMRAATPSMSGSDANSRSVTVMTPSSLTIGCGKGSFVCPAGSGRRSAPPLSRRVCTAERRERDERDDDHHARRHETS